MVGHRLEPKGPDQPRHGQPDLALGDPHAGADAATGSEHPVISLVGVCEVATLGGGEAVGEEAVGLDFGGVDQGSSAPDPARAAKDTKYLTTYLKGHWVGVAVFIMVHCPCVEDEHSVFRNEVA